MMDRPEDPRVEEDLRAMRIARAMYGMPEYEKQQDIELRNKLNQEKLDRDLADKIKLEKLKGELRTQRETLKGGPTPYEIAKDEAYRPENYPVKPDIDGKYDLNKAARDAWIAKRIVQIKRGGLGNLRAKSPPQQPDTPYIVDTRQKPEVQEITPKEEIKYDPGSNTYYQESTKHNFGLTPNQAKVAAIYESQGRPLPPELMEKLKSMSDEEIESFIAKFSGV
jgi:hypothetical protein